MLLQKFLVMLNIHKSPLSMGAIINGQLTVKSDTEVARKKISKEEIIEAVAAKE